MKLRKLSGVRSAAWLIAAMAISAPLAAEGAASQSSTTTKASADTAKTGVSLPTVDIVSNRATATTPVAFTNLSHSQLTANNDGRDIPYLLSMTPSVITTSDAGAGMGYTSMRVRGTDGSRINITANGIPINNPESHNVYWVNMPDLVSSLRQVQIQRGVGTSTNGAGAFGASVNMVTEAPSDEAYAELSGAYGMYNTNRQTLRAGTGLLGGHWTVDARISHLGSDGYIDRASSALWSYLGQVAYSGRNTLVRLIAFGGKEKTYMAWDYASKEEMKEYGRRYNPCGKYTDSDGKTAFYPDQNDNYIQHHFQLHVAQRLGEYWRLNVAAHFTKDDGYYDQYKTKRTLEEYGLQPFYDADGNKIKKSDLIRLKNNDNAFGGGMVTLNYLRGPVDLTIGGAANQFRGSHFGQVKWVRNYVGAIDPLQEYYRNTGRKFDSNVYARLNYQISRPFSAFADLQYRHLRYTIKGSSDNFDYNIDAPAVLDVRRTWDFFNPKVGLNYEQGPNRAFASWSVAHKEPTRDNFTDGDAANPPHAERLFDYELGYTFTHKLFSLGLNLYYMDYKDQLVVTGQLSDTGNPLSVNVPRSYRMGIELQGSLRPCAWFDWQINATLSRSRIKNFTEYIYEDEWTNPISFDLGETPIAFSPDFTLNNAFNFHVKGFEAQLTSQYVGKQYMNNARSREAELKAYFVSDLHLGYTFKGLLGVKSTRVGFSIYNLFSEKYCNNGYAGAGYTVGADGKPEIYRYAGYAAQAPIHVMGTLTLQF